MYSDFKIFTWFRVKISCNYTKPYGGQVNIQIELTGINDDSGKRLKI